MGPGLHLYGRIFDLLRQYKVALAQGLIDVGARAGCVDATQLLLLNLQQFLVELLSMLRRIVKN